MSIRTTVTLDDDVLERVKDESRRRGEPFRDTLNDLLRIALATKQSQSARAFEIKPLSLGYKPGLNYDDIASLLEYGEGEHHR
jgi:hypothetical protein